jgi:copper chaperone
MMQFEVKDMSCGHCVGAVTQAIKELDPEARVEVDLAGKRLSVESAQPRDALAQALAQAGYPPA